jgi:hypothetical protein
MSVNAPASCVNRWRSEWNAAWTWLSSVRMLMPRYPQLRILDVLTRERRERDRQREPAIIAEDDQRPHEVVPRRQKGPNRERRENRRDHRQHHRSIDAQLARTVDARGVEQIFGNRECILAN